MFPNPNSQRKGNKNELTAPKPEGLEQIEKENEAKAAKKAKKRGGAGDVVPVISLRL